MFLVLSVTASVDRKPDRGGPTTWHVSEEGWAGVLTTLWAVKKDGVFKLLKKLVNFLLLVFAKSRSGKLVN